MKQILTIFILFSLISCSTTSKQTENIPADNETIKINDNNSQETLTTDETIKIPKVENQPNY